MANEWGLLVSVYRTPSLGDCTNGGVSGKHDEFLLVDEDIDGPIRNDGRYPVLRLRKREIAGRETLHVIPDGETRYVMFGGNFVYTSDSRFRQVCNYPLPIHDRVER